MWKQNAPARYKIQLRNLTNRLIGTIRIQEKVWKEALENNTDLRVQCENIYADKTKRLRVLKSSAEYDYSADDIPQLLEFISYLLKDDRKKMIEETELPSSDIINIDEYLTKIKMR